MRKIVILGAGPTGLGAAYRLQEHGYSDWSIYEKNPYVGGLSASLEDDKGFTWDIGGHVIFSHYEYFDKLMKKFLQDRFVKHIRESWIWLQDQFIRYPFQNNFHFLDKDIVFECVKGIIDIEKNHRKLRNFEEWILSIFGKGVSKYFMLPYNMKVWATPPNKMAFDWIAERVSVINLEHVLKNVIFQHSDHQWGPNNYFEFPLHGGTGGLFTAFQPYIKDHLHLNKEAVKIDPRKKTILFKDGQSTSYDVLISTMPINDLVSRLTHKTANVSKAGRGFHWSSGLIAGIGIEKPCPSKKNWMYFPQNDSPFYRVTYLSNYSPNMTPQPSRKYFSFLCETSYSKYKRVDKKKIIDETIQGLLNSKLLTRKDQPRIISKYLMDVKYSFPVPFLGRNKLLKTVQPFLEAEKIFSRGRFGGWKYEVGNMDHSVMQGVEVVDRILKRKKEKTYTW